MVDIVEGPEPIRVVLVDAAAERPEISPHRAAGGRYASAQVFAVRDGRLVGELELALADGPVSGADLETRLRDAFGDRWTGAGTPPAPIGPPPAASVVIATTLERLAELDRCLASVLSLDYPDYEVILVDNRPDASAERARLHALLSARDPRVRVVTEPRPGISAARNTGARLARGGFVAFTDDDAVPHPGWLRGIASRFMTDPDVDCVSGVVLPAELETPAQIWFERSGSKLEQRYEAVSFHNAGTWRGRWLGGLRRARFEITASAADWTETYLVYRAGKFGMGANIAFRRGALDLIGGFEETLGTGTAARGGEDIVAIARLLHRGGRVTMDPASIVLHHHRLDYAGLRGQMYGYGVGASAGMAALVRSDPRHLVGLAYLFVPGLRVLFGRSAVRAADDYPGELGRTELRGLLSGPVAYARGVLADRRVRTP